MSYNATGNSAGRRIATLLDEGSFVEIGGAVTARSTDFNLQEKETPADGVITGYGVIDGNLVYVYSQDAAVLNGAIGEMHAKKIANIYDMAMKMGAPVIGLIDCAGLRLQEATDALEAFGSVYYKQAMASGVVPQIAAIFGMCGGGLAVVPGLADFTFMEEKSGKLFVNSPNALAGNEISRCDTSAAKYQSETAGLVDGIGTEADILNEIRSLICMIPANNEDDLSYEECMDDLNRICPDVENAAADTAIVLSQIADDQIFTEMKKDYAKEMVTGFIRLNGMTVGAVANRTKVYAEDGTEAASFDCALTVDGCKKAVDFVNFCDAFSIPVLTLTNVEGFSATLDSEKDMARAVARMTYAFAEATVPKVNVIIGNAYGSAYIAMNSKSIGADMVYAWENAKIGMMDANLAARIMYDDADMETQKEKAAEYAKKVIDGVGEQFKLSQPENFTNKDYIASSEHLFSVHVYDLEDITETFIYRSGGVEQTKSLIAELFEGDVTDVRGDGKLWQQLQGVTTGNRYVLMKYKQSEAQVATREQIPLVRLYEMYLIAIECSDNSAVYQPLINQLLTARSISLDMDNAGVDQKNQFVSMEYHKEFYGEGQAFYQYKRRNDEMIMWSNTPGSTSVYVLPVPKSEIKYEE